MKCHKFHTSQRENRRFRTSSLLDLPQNRRFAQSLRRFHDMLQNATPGRNWHLVTTSRSVGNAIHKKKRASKPAFRARLPQISHFAASKSTFSYEFSYEPTSKLTFRARLPSIFIACHKMPRLPRNLHLVTTLRSADNAIHQKHATRNV